MPRIARESLLTLEAYAKERPAFRARAVAHKRARTVHVGDHVTLLFEDELDAYNPLVPDGSNLKATMLIEYEDENARREALARLTGIEDGVWLRVDDFDKILAIADEDLERESAGKTSSVHFLRFELTPPMIAAFKQGARVAIGIDHPQYLAEVSLPQPVQKALAADFA